MNPPYLPEPETVNDKFENKYIPNNTPELETNWLDMAVFYKPNFFHNFFTELPNKLVPGGRCLLLFSNFGELTGTSDESPFLEYIENNPKLKLVQVLDRPVMSSPGVKGPDAAYWKTYEQERAVQLWDIVRLKD
eukprot:UN32631